MLHSSRRFFSPLLAIALMLASMSSAWSQEYRQGEIRIDRPWSQETPPAAPNGAGYLSLTNEGPEADRLIGIASPIAAHAEIHVMETTDGVARMHRQEDMDLPPGETVEFQPGGIHIMFLNMAQPIRQGDRVPVTLTLERAGKIDIELVVAPIGTTSAPVP